MTARRAGSTRLAANGAEARQRRLLVQAAGRLHVAVVDARGRPLRANGLGRWLSELASRRVRGAVTVALVSDARVRALNRTFRHVDRATDVLSFPTTLQDRLAAAGSGAVGHLGDIVIAVGVARHQAQQFGHGWATEVRILALHGLLHLIGYDHEASSDGRAMARIERTWRRRGGLPVGLIDRALARGRANAGERPPDSAKTGGGTPE